MQSEKGKQNHSKQPERKPSGGRVVSMRAWKTRKRIQHVRGSRSWLRYAVSVLAFLCAAVTSVCALASCVPFSGAVQAVVLTWFVGVIGSVLGLFLYVWRDRAAKRLLSVFVSALAVSFVAAVTKLMVMSH